MLLSIGMIVKNEEKYLRKCLEGLKPILENVRSELIIHDTGSTDSTVEIAREFTDKVYEIQWRDDFAWARNFGVSKARGKWFMQIDADEILVDATAIIDFFNSGEYKKYKSATISIKSMLLGGNFAYTNNPRLHEKSENVRFFGKIHEHIFSQFPIKFLDVTAEHYGYYFEDEAKRLKKHERNIRPLLELHEEDPKDIRVVGLIIQDYLSVKNGVKADEFLDIGFDLVGSDQDNVYYHVFAFYKKSSLGVLDKPEEAIEWVRDYFSDLKVYLIHTIEMRAIEGFHLRKLGRYKEAIETYKQAYELFKTNKNQKMGMGTSIILALRTEIHEDKKLILNCIAELYALEGDFDSAFEWSAKIDDHDWLYGLCNADFDDYLRLLRMKRLKEDEIVQEHKGEFDGLLSYFLETDKSFGWGCYNVLAYAIEHERDFLEFLQNLNITDSPRFVSSILAENKDFPEYLLKYLKKHADKKLSIKNVRVLSDLALGSLNSSFFADLDEAEYTEALKAIMVIRHKYLSMVYRDDVYCCDAVGSLAAQDTCVYYLNQAFENKDKDTALYARSLRMALSAYPALKDALKPLTDKLIEEFEQEETPDVAGELETLNKELAEQAAGLKSVIIAMIDAGQLDEAAKYADIYTSMISGDPEMDFLKKRIRMAKNR